MNPPPPPPPPYHGRVFSVIPTPAGGRQRRKRGTRAAAHASVENSRTSKILKKSLALDLRSDFKSSTCIGEHTAFRATEKDN